MTTRSILQIGTLVTVGLLVALAVSPAYARHGFEPPGLGRAVATQEHYTDDLLAIRGVVGTAVGLAANGDPVMKIYTASEGVAGLPRELDGVAVVVQVTGRIFAIDKPVSGIHNHDGDEEVVEVDPKARFDRPVPIGVSSGNVESIEISGFFISCSVGTLGARLTDGTNFYALSNNHVYALENTASIGSDIVQPGPVDTDPVCDVDVSAGDVIGTLADFVPIDFSDEASNKVDAAIASTTTGLVGTATPSDGYDTPKSTPFGGPLLEQSVQKYGRTTGLTKGTITGINATILVGYPSGVAQFVGQIEVTGNKGGFLKGGDSGSLLVTDPGKEPVGLLFAGPRSGKIGFANPIGDVLSGLETELGLASGALTVDGE